MIEAVRALVPALRDAAERTERDRRLAPELVAGLAETGVFRACVPRALGGGEVEPVLLVRVLEEKDGFLRIETPDGYPGWIPLSAVSPYRDPAFA